MSDKKDKWCIHTMFDRSILIYTLHTNAVLDMIHLVYLHTSKLPIIVLTRINTAAVP